MRAPQDEVPDPHGEERGNAARLEPRGEGMHGDDSTRAAHALASIRHPEVRAQRASKDERPRAVALRDGRVAASSG